MAGTDTRADTRADTRVRVVGRGSFAASVRSIAADAGLTVVDAGDDASPVDAMVFAPWDRDAVVPVPFADLTDEQFGAAWQTTMDDAVAACVGARESFGAGGGSIVLTAPTTGMAGGAEFAHWAAAAEGVHVLARSVARQWGPEGIAVNVLAFSPDELGIDPAIAGPVSIATPARPGASIAGALVFLCSPAARDVAGQTITVDGGLWM